MKYGYKRRINPLLNTLYGRKFSGNYKRKVLVLYEKNRISYSQIYPFLLYSKEFAEIYDAEFRIRPTQEVIDREIWGGHKDASHVLLQTWLTDSPSRLEAVMSEIDDVSGSPKLVYLDSFANADVRKANQLVDFSLYFKKSVPVDKTSLLLPTQGHTNLTEYYGKLYGIDQEEKNWGVPKPFLDKLRVCPNFLTSPGLAERFLSAPSAPAGNGRDIDVHARLGGTEKNSWYGKMRKDAEARVKNIKNISAVTGAGVSKRKFLNELEKSKVCFSPFGYGEVCWRDIEAILSGSVLLKPDMSHLITEPDLYRNEETYVSVNWDFSDLEEKVHGLLEDRDRREKLACTAWEVAKLYLQTNGPVHTYSEVFA